MALYYIDFNGFTPGSFLEPGWKWGQANGGYGASITDTGPTAAGKIVNLTSSSAGTKILSPNIVDGFNDIEALVRFRFSSATGKQGIVSLRYGGNTESNTTGYTLSGSVIGNVGQLAIDEGGTGYVSWTPWNYQSGVNYWARFRVIGNNMKAKVWQQGTAEPTSWMIDVNNSARPTGSYSGIHQYATGSVTYELLSFATDGDTAPAGPTLVVANASHAHSAPNVDAAVPTSTPTLGYSGGYGGMFAGYGSALGLAVQDTTLVVNNTTHSHTANGVTVTQVHTLAISNASHAHTAESPAITQTHALAVANAIHGHTADSPAMTQTYILAAQNALHSLTSDNIALVTGYVAAAQDATHSLTSDQIALSQAQTLVVNDTSHALSSDNLVIVEAKTLIVSDSSHDHSVDSIDIIQDHKIVIANNSHSVTSDSPVIIQSNLLALGNATHSVSSGNIDIVQFTLLSTPATGTFGLSDTSSVLVQDYKLAAQNALHTLKTTEITKIFNWTELGKDFGYYIPKGTTAGQLEEDETDTGYIAQVAIKRGDLEIADIQTGYFGQSNIKKGNL